MASLDSKMGVIEMIGTLNANKNVGIVWIELDSDNKWNREIVRLIVNRYTNVYNIIVEDCND